MSASRPRDRRRASRVRHGVAAKCGLTEFGAFNVAWMQAALGHLVDGGVFGTFIDWRG